MTTGITDLRSETGRVINIRKRDLTEQMMELEGLQGKNASVIKHMRTRISQEQAEFDLGGAKIHAVRSVHLKLLREVFGMLGATALKAEMAQLTRRLHAKRPEAGRRSVPTVKPLTVCAPTCKECSRLTREIQSMLGGHVPSAQRRTRFFACKRPPSRSMAPVPQRPRLWPSAATCSTWVLAMRSSLAQPEFADRLVRALSTRLRAIHEVGFGAMWSCGASRPLPNWMPSCVSVVVTSAAALRPLTASSKPRGVWMTASRT